jgi:hypothetical protein
MDKEIILYNFNVNLETIARIKNGHKIYIDSNQMIQLDEPYMFQGLWRYCYSISRKDALYVLTKLFNDIEIYINALYLNLNLNLINKDIRISRSTSKDAILFISNIQKLNTNIQNANQGIKYLQETYKEDKETENKLQRIIDKGNSLITSFQTMMQ